jgi:hypothetical protein
MAPAPTSTPTVATDAMEADRRDAARTPASRRSRVGREEIVADAGAMDSPARFAGPTVVEAKVGRATIGSMALAAEGAAAGADAWEAATAGGRIGSNWWSMSTITSPMPETVLRTGEQLERVSRGTR